jgi:CDP-diacylglycerol--glycerol-3-phosphate 3-phosphatidyltransferase
MMLLFMIANTITLSRLILLIIAVLLLYTQSPIARVIAFILTILLIIMDGIDGYVARVRGETSELGAVMDIAIDRVVENVYWIVYADLDLVPVWVALIVISRGIITDGIRGFVLAKGDTAFEMMKTPWGRWLVSGRLMRGFYGTIKTIVFAGLALFMALRDWFPLAFWLKPLEVFLLVLVFITLATTLLRGFPVIFESRRYFFNETVN